MLLDGFAFANLKRNLGFLARPEQSCVKGMYHRIAATGDQGTHIKHGPNLRPAAPIARVPRSSIAELLCEGRLVPLLEDWMPRSVGFFLYYPSRRQMPATLQAFVEFLKKEARRKASASPRERA